MINGCAPFKDRIRNEALRYNVFDSKRVKSDLKFYFLQFLRGAKDGNREHRCLSKKSVSFKFESRFSSQPVQESNNWKTVELLTEASCRDHGWMHRIQRESCALSKRFLDGGRLETTAD